MTEVGHMSLSGVSVCNAERSVPTKCDTARASLTSFRPRAPRWDTPDTLVPGRVTNCDTFIFVRNVFAEQRLFPREIKPYAHIKCISGRETMPLSIV